MSVLLAGARRNLCEKEKPTLNQGKIMLGRGCETVTPLVFFSCFLDSLFVRNPLIYAKDLR